MRAMSYETMKRVMAALAGVAEAVGNLRALFPAGCDIVDEVAEKVTEVSDHVLESAMLGDVGSPERTGKEDKTLNVQRSTPNAQVKKETATAPKAKKGRGGRPKKAAQLAVVAAKAGTPKEGPYGSTAIMDDPVTAEKPAQVMRICPDCGGSYLRTGNSQKRCKACGDAKTREAQAAWKRDKATAGEDKDGRLARIKAANERLDRIPEPEEGDGRKD